MSKGLPQLVGTELETWHKMARTSGDESVLHIPVRVARAMLEIVTAPLVVDIARLQAEKEELERTVEFHESF